MNYIKPDFDAIRKVYKEVMPELMERNRWADPYFYDWVRHFTPIESAMWGLIRSQEDPYYPQFPVGRYFVDFGNPHRRIAIECDGADFHLSARDKQRDSELADMGWMTVRFTGKECMALDRLPDLSRVDPFHKTDWIQWQKDQDRFRDEEAA